MLKAGETYKATLAEAGLTTTKGGEPQVHMAFWVEDGTPVKQKVDFYGSLKNEKAQTITVKALIAAGFDGNDIADLANYATNPTLFKPANISVELEATQSGKLRVKWVNTPMESKFTYKGATPKLAGAFAKARQEMGVKKSTTSQDPF